MPRKKSVDPIDQVLEYFELAPVEEVFLLLRLIVRIVQRRNTEDAPAAAPDPAAAPVKVRKTRGPNKPKVAVAADQPKPRRMKANSQPPTSEATPLVPLQAGVGDGDDNPVVE